MYSVGIYFEDKGWTEWHVDGDEAAWNAYDRACELAEAIGADNAAIWESETGDVLADHVRDMTDGYDDEDYEPDYDECGFDPYEGCYTFDC